MPIACARTHPDANKHARHIPMYQPVHSARANKCSHCFWSSVRFIRQLSVCHLQPDCLFNSLFRLTSKETSKPTLLALVRDLPVDSPHKGPVTRKVLSWRHRDPFFSGISLGMRPVNARRLSLGDRILSEGRAGRDTVGTSYRILRLTPAFQESQHTFWYLAMPVKCVRKPKGKVDQRDLAVMRKGTRLRGSHSTVLRNIRV